MAPLWRDVAGRQSAGRRPGAGDHGSRLRGILCSRVCPNGTPEVKAADVVNPVNTAWTLVAAFLVFGMQVGFTMLEAGFCRSRETVNVLVECVVDTCLCGILFYAIGFAFMFSHGNGFIGYHWFFLQDARPPMKQPASPSWRSGFFSSPSPIPVQPSLRAQ